MPEKSQIQETKRIPLLAENNQVPIKYYDDYPTLADRNYVAKPIQESFTGGTSSVEKQSIVKGNPMTFEEARQNVNPNYNPRIRNSYSQNCQSAVVVFEARMRGFDVTASIENQDVIEKLKEYPNIAFIDKNTGKIPNFIELKVSDAQECENVLKNIIKPNERYMFAFKYRRLRDKDLAHVLEVIKSNDNEIKIYDPQSSQIYGTSYLNLIKYDFGFGEEKIYPKILRVDDKEINYMILERIAKPLVIKDKK